MFERLNARGFGGICPSSTGKAASPECAVKHIRGACSVAYGDILFRHHYRDQSMDSNDDIAIAADAPLTERRAAVARAGRLP
ncbi:MAG TPA: hypothetical protein VGA19_09790 [Rhodospirillales bacterium]